MKQRSGEGESFVEMWMDQEARKCFSELVTFATESNLLLYFAGAFSERLHEQLSFRKEFI